MQTTTLNKQEPIFTVARLNSEVKTILESTFRLVWVEGEISNFSAPHSGHWYFCLKDANAQVRCAMFRGHQRRLNFQPKDGLHVLIKARVSLYENRGEFQLIAEEMEERGEGKLQRAFEALKKKLEAAGLFDAIHKKSLPLFPKQIGVITSATGAAIRDILNVLNRRYPCAPVIIYPALVQGETAAPAIVKAIQTANRRKECDILIVARGGGSLEDLWPFNEEIVAKAIFQSELPIISGVGHEIDFTIADFVADKRAPTPSAAAEIITPDRDELLQLLARQQQQLMRQLQRKLAMTKQQLNWVDKHLQQQHPKRRLLEKMQRLDFCELTLTQLQTRLISRLQNRLQTQVTRLYRQSPVPFIQTTQHQLQLKCQQLANVMQNKYQQKQALLANAAAKLNTMSPLATLNRGYAIAMKGDDILQTTAKIAPGDKINVRLAQGTLDCIVEEVIT